MENAKELLIQSAGTILFCVAIILLFHQVKDYSELLSVIKESYQNTQELYQSEGIPACEVTYAQLIASLMGPVEYDLEINGLLISKYEHSIDKIADYSIARSAYCKSYAYDTNGYITRIIYKSI